MIGFFDSGIGGLSVLSAFRKIAPNADIVYFGDTEHAPYGNKSAHTIAAYIAMALRRLKAEGATHIVSACNSASVPLLSIPIDLLRLNIFDVVEMVEPTVNALAPLSKRIALFGTQATIASGMYQQAFKERGVVVDVIAIPELAGLIEIGAPEEEIAPVVYKATAEAISAGAEILSLSCTHYPFVQHLFQKALDSENSNAILFNPADAVALEVLRRFTDVGAGTTRFLISKESPTFARHVEKLFGAHTIEITPPIYHLLKDL